MDRVLWSLPEFGKDGRSVNVLSLGSLLLAVGLHPEGAWVIPAVSRIARDRMVYWAEYQADNDIFSFPGSSPVTELLGEHDKPMLQPIKIGRMVDIDAKQSLGVAAVQNHRQYVQANTKKYFYDYFMICCGPFSLPTRVKYPDLMVSAFNSSGRLDSNRAEL
jgi:hypothetical protein